MTTKTKLTQLLIVMFMFGGLYAQDYKFGRVSKEELMEKQYPTDSSAQAAYLYKKRISYYRYDKGVGLRLITEIHNRIKIYSKDGFDFATETIDLYGSGGTDEKATSIKGYTYSLEGDEIVETKLDKGSIFRTQQSKNYDQVKFTMPNVKEGSVVEYQYKIISPYVQTIDDFVFQHSIPVRKLEAKMRILEYFKFNKRAKGFLALNPVTSSAMDHSLDINATEVAFDMDNIPALREEKFVTNIDNYRSGMKFEIVSLEIPGSMHEVYSKTWDDVVRTIYQSGSFGDELKRTGYFEDELDALLATTSDEVARIQKVLTFVKQKVKWNSYLGFASDEGTRKAYKEGTGNSADINLMLVSMLNHANITAHPVLVSTRDHGIPLFPTLEGFNYVIAAVKVGDGYHLLDATNVFSTFNVIPTRALNWYGRMVSEGGNSEVIDLMPKQKSMDAVMMNVSLNEDGSVEAKLRQQYTHNNAYVFRNVYNKGTEEAYLEELEKEHGDIEISDFTLENNLNLGKPVQQEYQFYKEDAYESIAGKLYVTPMFHLAQIENPFKSERREFPIDYGYPWEDKYMVTINIPDGYTVEYLPEPISLVLPEGLGKFTYNISASGSHISLRVEMEMNTPIFPPQYYQNLKELYRQVVEKESEKVILVKT